MGIWDTEDRGIKAEDSLMIGSGRLEVEIARPGRVYKGSRFDWTGFITRITLDKRHNFCVPEQYERNKGTGGIGFCNEFGIDMTPGYEEAGIGGSFTKIGIGLLRRVSAGPYEFHRPYDIEPYPVQMSCDGQSAKFTMEPVECSGYAVRLEKTVRVEDRILRMDYRLENTGGKDIATNEYCHNFMGIDGHKLGRDYCLSFPGLIKADRLAGKFTLNGDKILWEEEPEEDFYGIIQKDRRDGDCQWQLVHGPSGVGVKDISRLPAAKYALWGCGHVVSPEVFIDIRLKPGERMEWSREYEFFC